MIDDLWQRIPAPRISVITASYNQGRFIEQTIRSVIEQDYPNLEYIVIDGGSTDETLNILERYESHFAYWVSEPDRGQSDAINKGFRQATGDILCWINSDDVLLPRSLHIVGEIFASYPAVDWIIGQHAGIGLEGWLALVLPPRGYLRSFIRRGWYQDRMLGFIAQESCFWRRELWQKVGSSLDESLHYAMDFDLWRRFAEHVAPVTVETPLAAARLHFERKTGREGAMARYYAEMGADDRVLPDWVRRIAQRITARRAPKIRYNYNTGRWNLLPGPYFDAPARALDVLTVSTRDSGDPYARSAWASHQAALAGGVRPRSRMLVWNKRKPTREIIVNQGRRARYYRQRAGQTETRTLQAYPQRELYGGWLTALPNPNATHKTIEAARPGLLHLHDVPEGFVAPEALKGLELPIVWTLPHAWAFTGGCTHPGACMRFSSGCGSCPQLKSGREDDLSREIMRRKSRAWSDLNLTIITTSRALADQARKSQLFTARRVEFIPAAVDTDVFRPLDRTEARAALDLPEDVPLIAVGAHHINQPRRGLNHLRAVAEQLASDQNPPAILVIGKDNTSLQADLREYRRDPGQDDHLLPQILAAANAMLIPDEQEFSGAPFVEALACGLPVVAFDAAAAPDYILHHKTGYLAQAFDTDEIAAGIRQILDPGQLGSMQSAARHTAEIQYSLQIVGEEFVALYRELLTEEAKGHDA